MPRFFVQQHDADKAGLHWDIRFERGGVAVSFAIPKHRLPAPGERILAISVPDHSLEYASWEGTISSDSYGAGEVSLFDKGRYALNEWTPEKIDVILDGVKLTGRYVFVKTDNDNWLVVQPTDTKRESSISTTEVMLRSSLLPRTASRFWVEFILERIKGENYFAKTAASSEVNRRDLFDFYAVAFLGYSDIPQPSEIVDEAAEEERLEREWLERGDVIFYKVEKTINVAEQYVRSCFDPIKEEFFEHIDRIDIGPGGAIDSAEKVQKLLGSYLAPDTLQFLEKIAFSYPGPPAELRAKVAKSIKPSELDAIFRYLPWGASFGGIKWANIARAYGTIAKDLEVVNQLKQDEINPPTTGPGSLLTPPARFAQIYATIHELAGSIDTLNGLTHNTATFIKRISPDAPYILTAVSAGRGCKIVQDELSPRVRNAVSRVYKANKIPRESDETFAHEFVGRTLGLNTQVAEVAFDKIPTADLAYKITRDIGVRKYLTTTYPKRYSDDLQRLISSSRWVEWSQSGRELKEKGYDGDGVELQAALDYIDDPKEQLRYVSKQKHQALLDFVSLPNIARDQAELLVNISPHSLHSFIVPFLRNSDINDDVKMKMIDKFLKEAPLNDLDRLSLRISEVLATQSDTFAEPVRNMYYDALRNRKIDELLKKQETEEQESGQTPAEASEVDLYQTVYQLARKWLTGISPGFSKNALAENSVANTVVDISIVDKVVQSMLFNGEIVESDYAGYYIPAPIRKIETPPVEEEPTVAPWWTTSSEPPPPAGVSEADLYQVVYQLARKWLTAYSPGFNKDALGEVSGVDISIVNKVIQNMLLSGEMVESEGHPDYYVPTPIKETEALPEQPAPVTEEEAPWWTTSSEPPTEPSLEEPEESEKAWYKPWTWFKGGSLLPETTAEFYKDWTASDFLKESSDIEGSKLPLSEAMLYADLVSVGDISIREAIKHIDSIRRI